MKYEFAIKKETKNNGDVIYTPVVRRKWWLFNYGWQRIACMYGVYFTIELDFCPALTLADCQTHIEGYKRHLLDKVRENIKDTEYDELEAVLLP